MRAKRSPKRAALQLALVFDPVVELSTRLRQAGLPGQVRVVTHANLRVMVSWDGRKELRVHRGYAWAPDEVLQAIVAWARPWLRRAERRAASRILLAFPVHHFVPAPALRPRRVEPPHPGDDRRLERLRTLHRELNSRHFAGRLRKIEIRLSGRMRRKLGHYEVREATRAPAIVISRRHLQRDGWTEVERTLLHEMVHQWQEESGHPVDHGVEFKTKSRELGARSRGTVNF